MNRLPPGVVARAEHDEPVASQRGQPITEFAGQHASGQSEQQPELGVGRLAVFGHVERHGVLVAVDEHQPDLADVIAQPGDDAEQRRAVAAVDDREPARGHRRPDPFVQRVGHREQRPFVDQAGRCAACRVSGGQVQVVVADHVVVFEGVEQPGVAQRARRPRLVAGSPVAVERHSDQFDLGDCFAPRVRHRLTPR